MWQECNSNFLELEKKAKKKNNEILAALQYKPLSNISRSEKWGKKIQAAAYDGSTFKR